MYFAGVDIGSTTSKAVLIDEKEEVVVFSIIFTSFDRDKSGMDVLNKAIDAAGTTSDNIGRIVATGYGRKSFKMAHDAVPEIICHAIGTKKVFPSVRTIIDIGGQDSKVIAMDDTGSVTRFEMNDKCAAGTGRFFEVLTNRLLNVSMDELGDLVLKAKEPVTISSMCTIFAESEIISYLSQGIPKEDIAAGMSKSIVRRIISMGRAGQIQFQEPIVFSGGVANNKGVARHFEELLGKKITAIDLPQSTAALGAAVTAKNQYDKLNK